MIVQLNDDKKTETQTGKTGHRHGTIGNCREDDLESGGLIRLSIY